MLPRIPEWYCILTACHKLGAVIMPAPVILAAADVEYRLHKGKANVVITNTANRAKVDEACAKADASVLKHRVLVGGDEKGWLSYEKITAGASETLSRDAVEKTSSKDPFLIYFTSAPPSIPRWCSTSGPIPWAISGPRRCGTASRTRTSSGWSRTRAGQSPPGGSTASGSRAPRSSCTMPRAGSTPGSPLNC